MKAFRTSNGIVVFEPLLAGINVVVADTENGKCASAHINARAFWKVVKEFAEKQTELSDLYFEDSYGSVKAKEIIKEIAKLVDKL